MSLIQDVQCNNCPNKKGIANHWYILEINTKPPYRLAIIPLDLTKKYIDRKDIKRNHYCGEACLFAAIKQNLPGGYSGTTKSESNA